MAQQDSSFRPDNSFSWRLVCRSLQTAVRAAIDGRSKSQVFLAECWCLFEFRPQFSFCFFSTSSCWFFTHSAALRASTDFFAQQQPSGHCCKPDVDETARYVLAISTPATWKPAKLSFKIIVWKPAVLSFQILASEPREVRIHPLMPHP